MKVMYYIHSLGVGGAETICVQYMLELKKRNIDVILVVVNPRNSFLYEKLISHDVKVVSISPLETTNKAYNMLNSVYRKIISLDKWWNKLIYEEKPDIIHIHTMALKFFSPKIFPASKVVYTFHGRVDRSLMLMDKYAKKNLYHLSKHGMYFFAISDEIASDIQELLHTDNVIYIPNGVDINRIRNDIYEREEFLSQLDIKKECFVLGHVARFDKTKNQGRTLKIFKEVLKIKPDAYLIFVGDYNNNIGKCVISMVNDAGLSDKVRFLGLRDDATKIMSVFDAMILPSLYESFSLVMVEAQAHNVRAVASMTVPKSVICNSNTFRLSLNESDVKWAQYITGDFIEKHNYDLMNYSMNTVIDNMIFNYEKILKQ